MNLWKLPSNGSQIRMHVSITGGVLTASQQPGATQDQLNKNLWGRKPGFSSVFISPGVFDEQPWLRASTSADLLQLLSCIRQARGPHDHARPPEKCQCLLAPSISIILFIFQNDLEMDQGQKVVWTLDGLKQKWWKQGPRCNIQVIGDARPLTAV